MRKNINLIDLVKSFPTSFWIRNLALIQPRTSARRFAKRQLHNEIDSLKTNIVTKCYIPVRRQTSRSFGATKFAFFPIKASARQVKTCFPPVRARCNRFFFLFAPGETVLGIFVQAQEAVSCQISLGVRSCAVASIHDQCRVCCRPS